MHPTLLDTPEHASMLAGTREVLQDVCAPVKVLSLSEYAHHHGAHRAVAEPCALPPPLIAPAVRVPEGPKVARTSRFPEHGLPQAEHKVLEVGKGELAHVPYA